MAPREFEKSFLDVVAHDLNEMILNRRLIVTVGSGGVGKTTTAASLALRAACEGRTALVITIDPARRLATSLGLNGIGHEEREITAEAAARSGATLKGKLYAMMLDTKPAFDDLIDRVAPSPEAKRRILENHVYRHLSHTLTGSQEYIATEKLYDLFNKGVYDLIVLDTPPLKNALDFLEAPEQAARFFDPRIIRWFTRPAEDTNSLASKVFLGTGAIVWKLLGVVFGEVFLKDLNDFFVSCQDVLEVMHIRTDAVAKLLRSKDTAFLIVASPKQASLNEARHFYDQLDDRGLPFGGFIINQVAQPPAVGVAEAETALMAGQADPATPLGAALRHLHDEALAEELSAALLNNLKAAHAEAERHKDEVRMLARSLRKPAPIRIVPRFNEEIHDMAGLLRLNQILFAEAPT